MLAGYSRSAGQSEVSGRRNAAADDCPAGVRLQVAYQHRPALWVNPVFGGNLGIDGGRTLLRQVVSADNTGSEVWAESAYRSRSNEKWLGDRMLTSRIHRRKTKGKPMPKATARANAAKSSSRARVEHVFAHQRNRFGLLIRTTGLARAEAKLTLANLACNFDRLIFHERRRIEA